MKNKIYVGIAAIIAVLAAFTAMEFRRRALTVICPALLLAGILWSIALLFRAKKDTDWLVKMCASALLTILGIFAMVLGFDVVEVTASDVGVLETWDGGVDPNPLAPRTYIAYPNERIYIHSLGQKKLDIAGEVGKSVHPEYKVQSLDNQDMFFTLQITWKRMFKDIATLHSSLKPSADPEKTDRAIEDTFIVPVVLKIVNDCATVKEAISVYSGPGRVELHKTILAELQSKTGQLAAKGIEIEDCVIKAIRLDEAYVTNIQARQVAQVRKTRADEEAKAADAEALVSKAEAQKALNIQVAAAEGLKQSAVIAAEGEKEKVIAAAQGKAEETKLAAEADAAKVKAAAAADAEKVKLDAEARLEAALAEAKGIEALGKAQAEADKLKYTAYESPGAAVYAKIEVSKNLAQATSGIKGYLPHDINVTTLGADFQKAIEALVK